MSVPTTFPPVRACIFDVDGLLIDSEDIYTEIYNDILKSYGKPNLPWSIKAVQQGRSNEGNLFLLEWAQMPITLDEWHAKVTAQHYRFKNSRPLLGVPELVTNISRNSDPPVHITIASSASRANFANKASHLPVITDAFPPDARVFGDDMIKAGKRKKPAPDIFLLALEKINERIKSGESPVMPNECLVFEDSIAGVEAGRKAGMRVIWVPHEGLAKVCKGREEAVLMGNTEDSGAMSKGDGFVPGEQEFEEHAGQGCSLQSSDGWAERLTTLVDFPYKRFGIRLGKD